MGFRLPCTAKRPEMIRLDDSQVVGLLDPFHRYQMDAKAATVDEREASREKQRTGFRPADAPCWLKHDKQVLRFYAYFQESVSESRPENSRIRQCVICFFLEDGSMIINEPRVENSGIPQGVFLKRHRVPKPEELGGGTYQYSDFKCGETIYIYSRAFRVTGCDPYTKEFFRDALGVDFGEEEPTPDDLWAVTKKDKQKPGFVTRDMSDELQFRHVSMGGARKNSKLEQFMENDRKVLRFKAYWDDETRYGARTYYVIHYYLADDTMEINESLGRNSGRDPYPLFMKRNKIPKNPHISTAPGMLEPEPDCYKPVDLIVGQTIAIYNRKVVLYECDDFTTKFYREYLGVEQPTIPIPNPPPKHVKLTPPPHTGLGYEEDSLATCEHLMPKGAAKDLGKMMRDSGKEIRFECVMVNGVPEDENRKFVISMYLADEHIGVYETPVRNSGHWIGKFAAKDRVRNPETGTWYKPQDLYLGAVVTVKGTPLLLTRADEGTLRYMEAERHRFPLSDVSLILGKIAGLRGALEEVDAVTPEVLQRAAQEQLGVLLCEQELVTLVRALGEQEQPGVIPAAALVACLQEAPPG